MTEILIVEDEKPIANLIKMSLSKEGYSCSCVYDGAQAADMLEKNRYDLVLLDIMLPEYDGFELMEYIKPMEIPVIFITARGSINDRVKGLRAGAELCTVKRFMNVYGAKSFSTEARPWICTFSVCAKKTGWEKQLQAVNKVGYRLEVQREVLD